MHPRSIFRLPAALLLGVLLIAPVSADSPFDGVPDHAGLVVYVPSIDKVVEGVNKFGKAIGVDEMATVTSKDVNENMFEALEGLDTSKPMIFAMGADGEDSAVMICSLKDADAWKKGGNVKENNGVFEFTLEGEDSYAALSGQRLTIAKDSDFLKDAQNSTGAFAKKFAAQIKGVHADEQLVILADVEVFRTEIDAGMIAADAAFNMAMGMAASQAGESGEMAQAFGKWAIGALKRFVGDAEQVALTAQINGEGVRIRKAVGFKSGSVTEYLGKVRKTEKPLLRGLPDQPFMFAFAGEWKTPADTPSISEDMLDIMAGMIKPEQKEKFSAFVAKSREVYRKSTGFSGVMSGGTAGEGIVFAGNYFTEDPAGYRKLMIEGAEFAQGFLSMMKQGPMTMDAKVSEDKIAGKDVTAVEYNFGSDVPDVEKMLKTMYGEKPTMFATDGPDGLLMAFGSDKASRKLLGTMLDSSTKNLLDSPRIKDAMAKLSPNPQFLMYVDLGGFLAMATTMAESMGAGMPEMKLNGPTALVAVSAYLEPTSIRSEIWVPADPIKRIIEMATSAMGEHSHPME